MSKWAISLYTIHLAIGIMGSLKTAAKYTVTIESNFSSRINFTITDPDRGIRYIGLDAGESIEIKMAEGLLLLESKTGTPAFTLRGGAIKNENLVGEYYGFVVFGDCTIEVT